jgi:nicotine blue oxidoreductase
VTGRAKPALVVLAAGESARLGACKALVDLCGRTPLARLLEAGASFDDLAPLVIAGEHCDAIRDAAGSGVEVARHEHWSLGRTSSIRLARRLRPGCDLVIAPVDVPLVERGVFDALLAEWIARGSPPAGFLSPLLPDREKRGRRGHPIVLGRALALELETLSADAPLSALKPRARPLFDVEVESVAILDDLDTPEDLARLRARLSAH